MVQEKRRRENVRDEMRGIGGEACIEISWSSTLLAAGTLSIWESVNSTGGAAAELGAEIELCG